MKWLFLLLLISLASVFTLMAHFISEPEEMYKAYDSLNKAEEDGAVDDGLIPSAINPSASNIRVICKPDSTNILLSFKYAGLYPLDQNEWFYTLNSEVQKVFCKARKQFKRNIFEGTLKYFELQNAQGKTIYVAVDNHSHTAYVSL